MDPKTIGLLIDVVVERQRAKHPGEDPGVSEPELRRLAYHALRVTSGELPPDSLPDELISAR